ncbi:MAG: hypothetical protein KC431_10530, partial [Myxococcales bacterium]|nr:hypothetical protein [Myxococcales bacterium]
MRKSTLLACSAGLLLAACSDDSTRTDVDADSIGTTIGIDTGTESVGTESTSSDSTTTDTTDTTTDTTATDTTTDTTTTDSTDTTTDTTETGDPCGPECCPGEFKCEGEISLVCNGDGTDWEENEVCDPVQGVNCNPNFGVCEGACSQDAIGLSYIGCDY